MHEPWRHYAEALSMVAFRHDHIDAGVVGDMGVLRQHDTTFLNCRFVRSPFHSLVLPSGRSIPAAAYGRRTPRVTVPRSLRLRCMWELACAIGTLDKTCDLARSKHQKKGKSNSNQI